MFETPKLPQAIYVEHLSEIEGIYFTNRETEVIACVIQGRTEKEIAHLLCIQPKSVSAHTYNIRKKISGHAKSSILDFVESSYQYPILKNQYYESIQHRHLFETKLLNIKSKLLGTEIGLVVDQELSNKNSSNTVVLQNILKAHLEKAGIQLTIIKRDNFYNLCKIENTNFPDFIIFLSVESESPETIDDLLISRLQYLCFVSKDEIKELNVLNRDNVFIIDDYYCAFLSMLKKLLSKDYIEALYADFMQHTENLKTSLTKNEGKIIAEEKIITSKSVHKLFKFDFLLKKKFFLLFIVMAFLLFVSFFFLVKSDLEFLKNGRYTHVSESCIQSDLNIPSSSILLNRPRLIKMINDRMSQLQDIQTIALIGIGGTGKTTLARQYAKQQKHCLVWEINAETERAVSESFENLAYILARTDKDLKILKLIEDIKDFEVKKKNVLLFVKQRLKNQKSWFLIYDNVNSFYDIKDHFPLDSHVWGKGNVIITTRNKNIENNAYARQSINVPELDLKEKIALFDKIVSPNMAYQENSLKKTQFLNDLPPFPLDISLAAYYVKSSCISYEKYLNNLKTNEKNFISIQRSILQETNNYRYLRQSIVTFSIENIIQNNDDFKDLFLLISLIDSQNISRLLLESFKNREVVDHFIYFLNKHSIITTKIDPASQLTTYSIHRSIQKIILSYFIKMMKLESNTKKITEIIEVLEHYKDEAKDKEDFSELKTLSTHYERFLKHQSLLNDHAVSIIKGSIGTIAVYLFNFSKTVLSLLEENALKLEAFTAYNKQVAEFFSCLGFCYLQSDNYEKAESFLQKASNLYEADSTIDRKASAWNLTCLGSALRTLGHYNKSQLILERSLKLHQEIYSNHHPKIGQVLIYLGCVYRDLGEYIKAKEYMEKGFSLYKELLSVNHLRTAWSAMELSAVHTKLKEYHIAKNLLEYALKIYEKNSYKNDPGVLSIIQRLGTNYLGLKDHLKARELLEKSILGFEELNKNNLLRRAGILLDLAQSYFLAKDLDKAEKILEQSLKFFHQIKHPRIYQAYESLAQIYKNRYIETYDKGDFSEADKYKQNAKDFLNKALAVVERHFPKDSVHYLRISACLKEI